MEKEELNFLEKIQLKLVDNLIKIEITVLLILAVCFLLDEYYKTHLIKTMSVGLVAIAYLFSAKFEKDKSITTAWEIFSSKISKMSCAMVSIGFLFYIMNWPNPPVFVNNVAGGNLLICLIAFTFFRKRNPKTTVITNELMLRTAFYLGIIILMFCFPR